MTHNEAANGHSDGSRRFEKQFSMNKQLTTRRGCSWKMKGLVDIGIAWTFGVCGARLYVFHFRWEKGRAADSAVSVATARPFDLHPQIKVLLCRLHCCNHSTVRSQIKGKNCSSSHCSLGHSSTSEFLIAPAVEWVSRAQPCLEECRVVHSADVCSGQTLWLAHVRG
jgi:hypothetical protein